MYYSKYNAFLVKLIVLSSVWSLAKLQKWMSKLRKATHLVQSSGKRCVFKRSSFFTNDVAGVFAAMTLWDWIGCIFNNFSLVWQSQSSAAEMSLKKQLCTIFSSNRMMMITLNRLKRKKFAFKTPNRVIGCLKICAIFLQL